jgi:hypothetical protein
VHQLNIILLNCRLIYFNNTNFTKEREMATKKKAKKAAKKAPAKKAGKKKAAKKK